MQLILVLMLIAIACNNRSNKQKGLDDSNFTREDSSSIFSAEVTNWLNRHLKTDALKRRIALEERWETDSLQIEQFVPEADFYKNYDSLLYWSSDSSYILDVGSYGTLPVRNEKGIIHLEAREPDTEIALIDVTKNERVRLMYVGPSATIIGGKWLNNTDALVLGTFSDNNHNTDTLLWFINIQNYLFRLYNIKSK